MKILKAFRLDKELVKKLEEKANQENRSLSNLVETMLKDKVKESKKS